MRSLIGATFRIVLLAGALAGCRAEAPPAPPGLSTEPLLTLTCGWNGGLPPRSSESFSVTRLWKTPALTLTMVFAFMP